MRRGAPDGRHGSARAAISLGPGLCGRPSPGAQCLLNRQVLRTWATICGLRNGSGQFAGLERCRYPGRPARSLSMGKARWCQTG